MNGRPVTDAQISRALRAHLPERATAGLRERVFDAAETTAQLRAFPSFLGALSDADPVSRRRSLLIAAALLLALAAASAAAVGALRLFQQDPIRQLSLEPPADVMPTVRPSLGPRPSPTPRPILWTEARLEEDWPAPVRPEPDRGSTDVPILLNVVWSAPDACCEIEEFGEYQDPEGDTGSEVLPWVDIKKVTFCGEFCLSIRPVSDSVSGQGWPPVLDPREQWIAFGVVVDTDRDGVPDWRYGIDNSFPSAKCGARSHRVWRTDLHTGLTEWTAHTCVWLPSGTMFHGDPDGLRFGGDVTGPRTVGGIPERFYVWASVIQDGRVVATDFAPDVGWLLPSPGANPGSTPGSAPGSTQGGTYLLEDPFPVRLSMNVAAGWTIVADPRFYHAGGVTRDDGRTGLRFVMVDTLGEDPCAERAGAIDGRATVDDLVAFLAGLPLIDIQESTDVTLDGYRGRYLEFTRTAGEIDCGWGGLDGWPASSPSARNEVDRVWILDVDGVPLVVDAFTYPGASDGVREELRQIVDSIQIEP